jgi:outer membrane lipoprotein carrier protein
MVPVFALRRIVLLLALTPALAWAQSNGMEALTGFFQSAQSVRADFVQITELPAKAGAPKRSRALKGQFELQRPGQFKFHYQKPFEQVIQSDGTTLWVHDVDLKQATSRKLSTALQFAPALAIASAKDLTQVSRLYDLLAMPSAGGLAWVQATPRPKNLNGEAQADPTAAGLGGAVARIELGFRGAAAAPELAQMAIVDGAGQRTLMVFEKWQSNPRFAAGHFRFEPPAGTDVIRQ